MFIEKENKQFEMVEIQLGVVQDKYAEINGNVDLSNKNIVTKGAYSLLMKMKNSEE